jgi:hypothetical protein
MRRYVALRIAAAAWRALMRMFWVSPPRIIHSCAAAAAVAAMAAAPHAAMRYGVGSTGSSPSIRT